MSNRPSVRGVVSVLGALLLLGAGLVGISTALGPQLSAVPTMETCTTALEASAEDATEACKRSYNDALRILNLEYDHFSLRDRGLALAWQRVSGVMFFLIAIGILVFGLYLTHLEFNKERSEPVSLEIGQTGIKLSSEIIGIVVMVIALTYSYLYIDRIYPITEISQGDMAPSQTTAEQPRG